MLEHRYSLLFGDDKVGIFEDRCLESHVVMAQMTRNRCFPLIVVDMMPFALKATTTKDYWEWRKRFGNLNFQSLYMLADKEMVLGLPKLKKK